MNDNTQMTSAPGSSLIPDSTSVITTMHLVIIAIFAVLVVVGILWGARMKRARKAAEREVAEDNANIAAAPHPADERTAAPERGASPAPTPTPPPAPSPGPVATAPTPPPVADGPVVGTPPSAPSIDDEHVAATAPLDASPASEAEPAPAAPASDAIPVTTLKGLGPKVAARLAELGITDVRQLAALNEADAAKLDADLGSFAGRMTRDRWIEQARLLSAGDKAGYEATFGKL